VSYNLQIFHRDVKTRVESGLELDAFEHPNLETADLEEFLGKIGAYGYTSEAETSGAETPDAQTFVKGSITLHVFETMIAFSVPYGTEREEIFEALQDSSELVTGNLALFNPQEDEWTIE
jgi:hypothetical protein